MSAFSREPVAVIPASEASALWQAAKLTALHREVAGEESNPVYQATTALYRVILAARELDNRGTQTRQAAALEDRETWTTEQIAKAAGVANRTVRLDCQTGTLPATQHRPKGPWSITAPEALTYISWRRKQ